MENIDQLKKNLEEHKKAIVDDAELDEEEQLRIQKNKELMDRFNAINDSLKIDENLLKPSEYEIKFKKEQEEKQAGGNKLDNLESEFSSIFAKMGELLFKSGFLGGQAENQGEEEKCDQDVNENQQENTGDGDKDHKNEDNSENTLNKEQNTEEKEQKVEEQQQ